MEVNYNRKGSEIKQNVKGASERSGVVSSPNV